MRLSQLIRILWIHKSTSMWILFWVLTLAVAASLLLPKKYTGEGAVVVDAAGEIFGDAPNSAARVQTLADPGTVLITARVQRQVAGLFVAEDRGLHELKGVPRPVALYRIVRASGGRKGRNAFFVSALAQIPSRRASPAQPEPTTHPALDAAA